MSDLEKTVKKHAQNIRSIIQGCSTESVVRNGNLLRQFLLRKAYLRAPNAALPAVM